MTILNAPCCFFIYDPFAKIQICEIMQIVENMSVISNYNDIGYTLYAGVSVADCEAKITELQLTPITEQV